MKIESGSSFAGGQPMTASGGYGFPKQLRQATEELESMLLSDVFSKLQQSFAPEEDRGADPGHETLSGIAGKALCDSIAAHGGLGIGAVLSHALTENDPKVSG
jgi:hypothetical protein